MASKKYQTNIKKSGETWTAQVTRQITSRKTHVSKEQTGFTSEADANEWANARLSEFVSTQHSANKRQGSAREKSEEIKRQRSARRAEKTESAKLAKEETLNAEAMADNEQVDR